MTSDASASLRFRVEGMDCAGCATKIEKAVKRLPGVSAVQVSFTTGSLTVEADPKLLPAGKIEEEVIALGYDPTNVTHAGAADPADPATSHFNGGREDQPWWRTTKARITGAAGVALLAAYGVSLVFPDRAFWVFAAATAVKLTELMSPQNQPAV